MRIQHNIAALNSYRNLGANNNAVSKNLEKLSSGYRINRAGDDAAGLAISEKMRSQITGLNTATKNANDGISLVQTAEGALTEVHSMLNRMVEIATQSSNGVYEDTVDRAALQDEMNAVTDEIDRISEGTNFNKKNLLDGSLSGRNVVELKNSGEAGKSASVDLNISIASGTALNVKFIAGADNSAEVNAGNLTITLSAGSGKNYSASDIKEILSKATAHAEADNELTKLVKEADVTGIGVIGDGAGNGAFATAMTGGAAGTVQADSKSLNLQIGDTNDKFNKLDVSIRKIDKGTLGINNISVTTEENAGKAIDAINAAINLVSTQRGELGAIQNRLEHTINNLSVNTENMTAAESRIRDVDMADEMMKYTKNNILVQASQAMLAQANQVPQGVLQLLQ